MKIEKININEIIEYSGNAKEHPEWQIEQIKNSIQEFGFNDPIAIDEKGIIIEGHGRYLALKELGYTEVEVIRLNHLTEEQKAAYAIAHNKLTMNTEFNIEKLQYELNKLEIADFDLNLLGFSEVELEEIMEDEIEEMEEDKTEIIEDDLEIAESENIVIKTGDLIELGKHKVMCGDSTNPKQIMQLLGNKKVDLVFTDPPYGMKKEKDGVANDNLNFDNLLEFNKKWIPLSFENLKENGSWYCWGIDEPLMDIYSNILKPKIKNNEITFRNLITWNKGNGQGQKTSFFKMYTRADEKCLFVMNGVQGFNDNSENHYEGWEPIRQYLAQEIKKCGGTKAWKKVLNNQMGKHYFTKSQWLFPTEENYKKMQNYGKEYDAFKKEYSELRKEYEIIKQKFNETRPFFDNTHDSMNNVWTYENGSVKQAEFQEEIKDAGGHATPKPQFICCRAIKSSSRENERVLDLFGGSGSTLIACEQLNRKAYLMEFESKWVQTIIERYLRFTGSEEIKINGKTVNWEEYKNG